VCDGASDELTVVRNLHTEKFADAPRTVPADYEKKGRKKRSGGGRRRPIRNFFRGLSG
jgi:hypothetical protein